MLGVKATEEEAMSVVMAVKERSLKTKALLTDDEFLQVLNATLPAKAVTV